MDLATLAAAGRLDLGSGRYGRLLWLEPLAGHPMLTFTAPWAMADVELSPPAPAYRATIAAGLAAAHGLDPLEAVRMVADYPGAG